MNIEETVIFVGRVRRDTEETILVVVTLHAFSDIQKYSRVAGVRPVRKGPDETALLGDKEPA